MNRDLKPKDLLLGPPLVRGILLFPLLLGLLFCSPASVLAFSCKVNATAVSFGSYDPLSTVPAASTGSIDVTCNVKAKKPQAPLAVDISISAGNSGSFGQRFMMNAAGDMLNYNLYMDAGGGTVWGDGTGGSGNRIEYVSKESPFKGTVYGRIPAGQNVTPGSYSDLLTVTVIW